VHDLQRVARLRFTNNTHPIVEYNLICRDMTIMLLYQWTISLFELRDLVCHHKDAPDISDDETVIARIDDNGCLSFCAGLVPSLRRSVPLRLPPRFPRGVPPSPSGAVVSVSAFFAPFDAAASWARRSACASKTLGMCPCTLLAEHGSINKQQERTMSVLPPTPQFRSKPKFFIYYRY
jgi:hypothetical protein